LSKTPFVIDFAEFNVLKLVDADGKFYEEIGISEAKKKAKEANLDLVCFKEGEKNKNLAFCKIIDYGKWKYEQGKKEKKNNINKKVTKEIRLSPLIGDNDVAYKVRRAMGFLDRGDDVVFCMRMKGRQLSHPREAEERLEEIVDQCVNGKIVKKQRVGNNFVVRMTKE
jgi:translation initiation factor IF-3